MSHSTFNAPSLESLAELLPQYGIESFIAQGGMGAVYKARQLSLDRNVAIKVLPKELGKDTDFRESFITEAKAMARLNHPNLLGVFDYGDVDGMPYIVMEYVEGGSLHEAAWNHAIEPATAVAIVKGICDGLAHAHENGIVHRDIKPSNILLTTKAEPKVADFGLAQAADATESGIMMGTPGYTAPEVFHDYSQAGELADIYSVGVILHQLLTGIDPTVSHEPPSKATGNLRLDAIWNKATHITPTQRYRSVIELATDLDKWTTAINAQQKAAISTGNTTYQPTNRSLPYAKNGGGVFVKALVIGILLIVGFFTYQMLADKKETPENDITDIHESASPDPVGSPDPVETAAIEKVPTPIMEPPTKVEPDPTTKTEIAVKETEVTPELPPVVHAKPKKEPEPVKTLPPGDPELRDRAIGLIQNARTKRDKELADIASSLTSARDASARRAKELSILEAYRNALTLIRNSYVSRLQAAAAEAAEGGLKSRLLAQAERTKDLEAWAAELSPETERVPKRSTSDFAGKWNQSSSNGKSDLWIAHSDGRLEVEGQPWKGSWKMQDNGTLEVMWPDKPRPYIYKRDGDGWDGKTSFGQETKLTPHHS